MSEKPRETPLYMNVIAPLNRAYNDLTYYYAKGDCCTAYLKTFELYLSQNCPDMLLWNFPEYRNLAAIQPLPEDDNTRINSKVFYNYMRIYEIVMRRIALVDKRTPEVKTVVPGASGIKLLKMGGL